MVLQRLREDTDTRDIPVIMISADATTRQIERLLSPTGGYAGAQHYITRPIDVKEFLNLVDELLADNKQIQG